MSVLVVGSVAYDNVVTPAGSRGESLGGSATYFSVASSYFTPVRVVAVVGEDFRDEHVDLLKRHEVDVSGLVRKPGKTFRWSGVYSSEDVNARTTLDTQLNVFADFSPKLNADQAQTPVMFLANIDPDLQLDVLNQAANKPELVALDTMNFWIEGKNSSLRKVIKRVDVVLMDEGEAREISSEINLVKAARHIMEIGPTTVVVKRASTEYCCSTATRYLQRRHSPWRTPLTPPARATRSQADSSDTSPPPGTPARSGYVVPPSWARSWAPSPSKTSASTVLAS